MRISCPISLEDLFLPYPLYFSAVLIRTYPVLAVIRRQALRSASMQSTVPDSAPDSTRLQPCTEQGGGWALHSVVVFPLPERGPPGWGPQCRLPAARASQ